MDKKTCFIIAELSANHGGKIEITLETVRAAKRAGADAIKIQTYTADTITFDSKKQTFFSSRLWRRRRLSADSRRFFWRRAPPSRGSRPSSPQKKSRLSLPPHSSDAWNPTVSSTRSLHARSSSAPRARPMSAMIRATKAESPSKRISGLKKPNTTTSMFSP